MEITWHGYSCFSVKTKKGTMVVNPYKDIGLKLPALSADVVMITNEEAKENNAAGVNGDPKVFAWPGEYEVSEIAITMEELPVETKSKEKALLLNIDADSMHVAYLTDLSFALTDELIEKIGNVDVLIVPANMEKDGFDMIHQAVEEIEPRIIVPIHYSTPGLKIELSDLSVFLKKANLGTPESKDKLVLGSRAELPQEKTELAVLNPITA